MCFNRHPRHGNLCGGGGSSSGRGNRDGQIFWIFISTVTNRVGNTAGVNNEAANSMMQKCWDSDMALIPDDDDGTRSDSSLKLASEGTETGRSIPYPSSTSQIVFHARLKIKRGGCTYSTVFFLASFIQQLDLVLKIRNLPMAGMRTIPFNKS